MNRFEKHPLITALIIGLGIVFAIDFLAAKAYKQFNGYAWGDRKAVQNTRIERSYRIPSEIYHHDLAKNKSIDNVTWGSNKLTIRTNSLGFRDRTVREVPLVSGKYRILFMGDSFTEGRGFDYEYTFVSLVDSALAKKDIETLNAAVSSHSPIIYWRKAKHLIEDVGLKFDEMVVFLDISDAADEMIRYDLDKSGNVIWRDSRQGAGTTISEELTLYKTFIKDNTILTYAFLHWLNETLFPKKYKINFKRGLWTVDKAVFQEYGEAGLARMSIYMDKLSDLLKEHNIKLIVAVYPWEDQIVNGDSESIQVSFWKDWCERHDVPFLNYFPYFFAWHDIKERERLLDKYFIRGDVHWNKEGHRLVADTFLRFYENRTPKAHSSGQ